MEAEFSLRVQLAVPAAIVHTVNIPTDGQEDAQQLHDIMDIHLQTRRTDEVCEDTEWLHMMLVQKDVLCPCLHDSFPESSACCSVVCESGEVDTSWFPDDSAQPDHGTHTCCVCQCAVDPKEATCLPCNHFFHPACIARWHLSSNMCPVCRSGGSW